MTQKNIIGRLPAVEATVKNLRQENKKLWGAIIALRDQLGQAQNKDVRKPMVKVGKVDVNALERGWYQAKDASCDLIIIWIRNGIIPQMWDAEGQKLESDIAIIGRVYPIGSCSPIDIVVRGQIWKPIKPSKLFDRIVIVSDIVSDHCDGGRCYVRRMYHDGRESILQMAAKTVMYNYVCVGNVEVDHD
jgi:hypothetical protein